VLVVLSALCVLCFSSVNGEACTSPQVTSQVYTTSEQQMSSETVVIVEFSLACKNGVKGLNLYADFNGRIFPASRVLDSDKYQVSFIDEHKKLPAGRYSVRFFDEVLYSEIRKAQRNGEDTSAIKSLFDIAVNHQGVSHGPWVQTEHMAAALAALVWYVAYTTRSRLQS